MMKLRCTFPVTWALKTCVLMLGVLALSPALCAQTTPPPAQPDAADQNPVFRAGTTLVLVPALVRTDKGQLVYSLTAADFTLTDNGVPQKLSLEEDTGSQPLALVIVAEVGAAGAEHLANYSKLGPMVDAVTGDVPRQVAVISFDSEPLLAQDFTPDLDQVNGAINRMKPGNDGAAIFDSLHAAVDLLRKQPPTYRRAILLISETRDQGSQAKLEDTLRAISDTNTAIYSMGFSTTRSEMKHEARGFSDPDNPGPAGGCMSQGDKPDPDDDPDPENDPDTAPGKKKQGRAAQAYDCASLLAPPLRAAKMLAMAAMNGLHSNAPETVAQLTGGEYYKFENEKNFEKGLMTISNHLPNRYVLSFQPQSPQPGLHNIKLQLKDFSKMHVTARSSYWVDSGAPATAQP